MIPPDSSPQRRQPARPADVLWLAIAGTVMTACVQVAVVETQYLVFHQFTWTSRQYAWLSLGGNLVWFLGLAVPITVLVVGWPRRVPLHLVAGAFGALAAFAALLLIYTLHPIAQIVLALGVGATLGRRFAGNRRRWLRGARWSAMTGACLLGLTGWILGREPGAPTGAPAWERSTPPPNILLLILDTVRAANLSVYGYARPTTPILEQLAPESTVFDQAYSAAPWTAPSHASMMTGVWASQAGADYLNAMHDSLTTVAEVLAGLGYRSGGFMANAGYAGYQLGISRGFSHYEDFPLGLKQAMWGSTLSQTGSGRLIVEALQDGERWKIRQAITHPDLRTTRVRKANRQVAAEIADHFLAWRARQDERPWFAMLNFMDAHAPYESPEEFRTRFGDPAVEENRYDGAIAYADSIIGQIVERLRANGDLDRTVIIVTADHGEQWGEHDLTGHGNSLYLPVLHVPLLVRMPGSVPAGIRIADPVSLRDLAATLVEFAGGAPGSLPGVPLSSAWRRGDNAGLSPIFAEAAVAVNPAPKNLTRFGPIRATLDATGHAIHYGDGREEFFAWRDDPAELSDLSSTPEGVAALLRSRALIEQLLGTGWPPPRKNLY